MSSPIVTSLPAYIEEHRLPLIAKTVLGAKTTGLVTLESDVKSKTALNLLVTDVTFGNGGDCGWNDAGTSTLSQRYIDPANLKVNMSFCDKKLLGKWASYQVNVAAGNKQLPFEEDFVNGVIDGVNAKVEKLIWQGNKSNSNEFDGFCTILADASASTVDVSFASGATAYNKIKAMYAAMPAEILDKEDTCIFVSASDYAAFIQDLVAANLYHFNPDYKNGEYMLPGTSIRVISTNGLNGSRSAANKADKMVAGRLSNMFYGCSSEDDKNTFDIWYSKDNREFRLAIEFIAGVQVAFPDHMVLGAEA